MKLVKLEEKYKSQLADMLDEWYSTGEKIVPHAIRKVDYHDFETKRRSHRRRDKTVGTQKRCVIEQRYWIVL